MSKFCTPSFLISCLFSLALVGCAAANKSTSTPVAQMNGQVFGGGDQLEALVKTAAEDAEAEIGRLLRLEDSSAVGDYHFCNTAFLCGILSKLATNETKLAFVQTYLRTPAELQKLADAFKSTKVVLTSKSEDTQGNQALASAGKVTLLIPKIDKSTSSDLIALLIHEHLHIAGVFGSGTVGQMTVEEFVDAAGASVVANRNKRLNVASGAQVTSAEPIVVFSDNFNRANATGLGSGWDTVTAGLSIKNNAVFAESIYEGSVSKVKNIFRRDVSIRANADLGATEWSSWIHLKFRYQADGSHYLVAFGQRRNLDYDITICVYTNGAYRELARNFFPYQADGLRGEVRVDMVGGRITTYLRGTKISVVDDATLPSAGALAIESSRAFIDDYKALVP